MASDEHTVAAGPGRDTMRGVVSRGPAVVAHRGASQDIAEHTLAAYEKAIVDGADGLECDVRLTRDGVLVCVHDRRVDRTSSGHGAVSALELADLAELDFASWRGDGDADFAEEADRDQTGVLTLERLLGVVADCGRRLDLAIETKHPTRYGGLVELALVELLGRHGWLQPDRDGWRVRVMSFAVTSLRRVQLMAPALPTVYLMRRVALRYRDGTLPRGVPVAGPHVTALRADPGYVARLHARGHQVHVWTANDPVDVDFLTGLGVDAIITDRPAAVLRQLGR